MKLDIGIDLDGVVVDSPQQVVNYVNDRLDLKLTINDFTTYSMEDALPDKYKWVIESAFRDSTMWKNVKLIDGAYETLKQLYEESYNLYFVTSSLPSNLRKKINHLARNLDFLPKDYALRHTINTQYKQIINLDILVDDGLFNLIGDRSYHSICFNMPYNQTNDAEIPNFYRAYNWHDVYCWIKTIEKKLSKSTKEQTKNNNGTILRCD